MNSACCGPNTFTLAKGSPTVYVNGKPIARVQDDAKHCGGKGAIVEGSRLVATVPETVARAIVRRHPRLRTLSAPFVPGNAPVELVWRSAVDEDDAIRFVRDRITELARAVQ